MSVVLKLKKVTVVFLAIIGTVTVILCSDTLKQGVKTALSLCSGSVIPSLFLFTALALFIAKSYVSETLGKVFSILFRPILGLSAKESTAFLLSCLAGYPVGAKLLDSLYRDGKITRPKALKMLTFSVNAGPAFIVTAVGGVILKSTSDGLRLTLIHFTATLILGILVNILPDFKPKNQPTQHKKPVTKNSDEPNLIDLFVLSVAEAGQTMLNICIFIVFFGAVGYFLATSPIGYAEKLSAVIEVTSGLFNFTRTELPEISFFLGFGGISVIFQVLSTAKINSPAHMDDSFIKICPRYNFGVLDCLSRKSMASLTFNRILQRSTARPHFLPNTIGRFEPYFFIRGSCCVLPEDKKLFA